MRKQRKDKVTSLDNARPLFLSDEPITVQTEDAFGHTAYVDALCDIVTRCPTPFAVGVFGKWGTGKSGIARRLQESINKVSGCRAVLFDAWQYVGNSFRRQFLIEADEQLGTDLHMRCRLARQVTETVEGRIIYPPVKRLLCYLASFGVLWIVAALLYWRFTGTTPPWLDRSFTLAGFAAFFWVTAREIRCMIKVLPTQFTYPRIDSPEQFRRSFEEILDKLKDAGRVVLIFDNLDRCQSDRVLEILSAIKTFLDDRRCVYVLPCDDEALMEHIKAGLRTEDPQEYLRKLLNTFIRIPPFIRDELQSYVRALTDMVATPFDDRARLVLVSAAVILGNPRIIKRVVNCTSGQWLLARQIEGFGEETGLAQGAITGDVGFLAKIVVLREYWPKFVELLSRDDGLLRVAQECASQKGPRKERVTQYNEAIAERLPARVAPSSQGDDLLSDAQAANRIDGLDDARIDELLEFLDATRAVMASNVGDFLRLKAGRYEALVADKTRFRDDLVTRRVDAVVEALRDARAKGPDNVAALVRLALEDARRLARQGEQAQAVNIFGTLTDCFEQVPDALTAKLADEAIDILRMPELADHVEQLETRGVLRICAAATTDFQNDVVSMVLPARESDRPFPRQDFEAFGEFRDILQPEHVSHLRSLLVQAYDGNEEVVLDVMGELARERGFRDAFSDDLFGKAVAKIVPAPLDELNSRRVDTCVATFPLVASIEAKLAFAEKLISMFDHPDPNAPTWGVERQNALEALRSLRESDMPQQVMDRIADSLLSRLTTIPQTQARLEIVDTLLEKLSVLPDQRVHDLSQHSASLMQSQPAEYVSPLLDRATRLSSSPLRSVIVDTAQQIIKNDPREEWLEKFAATLPKDDASREIALLAEIIASDTQAHSEVGVKVTRGRYSDLRDREADISPIIDAAISKALSVPVAAKDMYFDLLHEVADTVSPDSLQRVASEMTNWLVGNDIPASQFAAGRIVEFRDNFSRATRQMIAGQVVSSLAGRPTEQVPEWMLNVSVEFQEDVDTSALAQLLAVIQQLLTSPDESTRTRGLTHLDRIRRFPSRARAGLLEALVGLLAVPSLDPQKVYEVMSRVDRPKQWPDTVKQQAQRALSDLSKGDDESLRGWAETLVPPSNEKADS